MPDFSLKQYISPDTFVNAFQRKAQLQNEIQQQQQALAIQGVNAVGNIATSLYNKKKEIAQALSNAKMYAASPEGQQTLGTNQVATGLPGQPVTQNQTAAYDPNTGTVTPNQSPVTLQDIQTSMLGLSPKDMMENQIQSRLARTQQGDLALKQQIEPQRLAVEAQKAKAEQENAQVMRLIQGMLANSTIKNQSQERLQASENAQREADKAVISSGSPLNPFNPVTFSEKRAALQRLSGNGSSGWKYVGKVEKK